MLFLSLPTDTSCKKGDAVGGFGAVTFRLIGPLHRPAHGWGLKFAAGDGFAGETLGFFDAFFFRLGSPIIPRFSEGGVFTGEVDGDHLIGRKDLRNRIFSLRDEEMDHRGALIVTENKADDFVSILKIQGDIPSIVECGLKGVLACSRIGAGERCAFDRTGFLGREGVFFGLGHGKETDATSGSVGDGGFNCAGESRYGTKGVIDRAGFVSTVNHAIPALFVPAFLPVIFPSRIFHELFEGGDVAILEEIAGLLPAEDIVGGISPRGAVVIHVPLEELEEIRGEIEFPGLLSVPEDLLKKFFRAVATEEMLLVGGFLVAVAGREHHALHFELHHFIEKLPDAVGICPFKKGGVGGDAESPCNCLFDSFEGDFVGSVATDGGVVFRFETVHVNAEGEVFGWFEEIDFSLEKEGVRAEVNVFFACDEAFDDLVDFRMDQRFATGDRDHGGSAFVGGGPALLGGQPFIQNVIRVLDLAATRTSEIATEEGLEHEDERVSLVAAQFLPDNIRGDCPSLADWDWHRRKSEATNTF